MSDTPNISRFATCPTCSASVVVVDGRLITHDAPVPCRAVCSGSGSAEQLGRSEGRLVAIILEAVAEEHNLDWVISYEGAPGEPKAFRVVRDGLKLLEPPHVIGETETEARDCISLAAEGADAIRRYDGGRR